MNTIETKEIKPSELAMKAAVALFPDGYANCSYEDCYPNPVKRLEALKRDQAHEALTIDRETNLPTLLKQRDALKEACEKVLADTRTFCEDKDRYESPRKNCNCFTCETVGLLQSALALCKEDGQ